LFKLFAAKTWFEFSLLGEMAGIVRRIATNKNWGKSRASTGHCPVPVHKLDDFELNGYELNALAKLSCGIQNINTCVQ